MGVGLCYTGGTMTEEEHTLMMRAARKKYRMDPRHRKKVLSQKKRWSLKRRNECRQWLTELREWHGGRCYDCHYDEELNILQFHHVGKKDKAVSAINTRAKMIAEAQKCVLLCPNCHAKRHLSEAYN